MKRSLLLLSMMILFVTPSMASVTVEEMTETEAMINAGYSQSLAEDVFVAKRRATSKPIEPLYESSQNKFMKVCKFIYSYVDPAQDRDDRVHHDIKLVPDKSDL